MEQCIRVRTQEDEDIFFVEPSIIRSSYNYSICKRNHRYGVCNKDEVSNLIIPCIYDSIVQLTNSLFVLRIDIFFGLYDINDKKWTCRPFTQYYYQEPYQTIKIEKDYKVGLYSIDEKKVVIPIKYEEVTNSCHGDYLWVKKDNQYHYVKHATGEFISLYEMKMAYDTENGMFAMKSNGEVAYFTEEGYEDEAQLRKIVAKNKGRLKLRNFKYHIVHTIDIYGYVLHH